MGSESLMCLRLVVQPGRACASSSVVRLASTARGCLLDFGPIPGRRKARLASGLCSLTNCSYRPVITSLGITASRQGQPAGTDPTLGIEEIECVAGRGIRGDRFFDYQENYKGQVTFFAMEVLEALRRELNLPQAQPEATRRNVFVRGADLNALIGAESEVQGVLSR